LCLSPLLTERMDQCSGRASGGMGIEARGGRRVLHTRNRFGGPQAKTEDGQREIGEWDGLERHERDKQPEVQQSDRGLMERAL
jgi:hypothetical protein